MAYMEQMQSSLKYLVDAAETGRRSADGMLSPVNGAIRELTGAASELENIPFVGPAIGAKLQRVMRGVDAAQAKVGQVAAVYGRATRAATRGRDCRGGAAGAKIFSTYCACSRCKLTRSKAKVNPRRLAFAALLLPDNTAS